MFGFRFNLFKLKLSASPRRQFKTTLKTRLQIAAKEQFGESEAFNFVRPFWQRTLAPATLVLVAVFSLSSYAYASPSVGEDSILYPVKTNLEKVESVFHRSPEAKARFATRLLDRRFAEVTYGLGSDETNLIEKDSIVSAPRNQARLTSTSDETTVVSSAPDTVKQSVLSKLDSIATKINALPIDDSEKAKLLEKIQTRKLQIEAGIRPSQKILEFRPKIREANFDR